MRVKRFVASDIHEAMARVKSEMGKDAVILHTRYFKEGGILGMFRKKYVEVTAAVDNSHQEIIARLGMLQKNAAAIEQAALQASMPANTHLDLSEKFKPLPGSDANTGMAETSAEEKSHTSLLPRLGKNLHARLVGQGIEEKIAARVVKSTIQQLSQPENTQENVNTLLYNNLLKPVKNKSKPLVFGKGRFKIPKVYAMVGPTGVGKTTTIAKLAAMYALVDAKRVAFVTVDTYRIAATEQLKTIGEIMNVPVNVVYSYTQLEEYLMEASDSDIIFLDTAGRSHKNTMQIEELQKYLEIAKPEEVFLALSATSQYQDLLHILDVYKNLDITRIIFTKLDETSYFGSIYNIACKVKYPLSYFTTGQNIPDDIEIADPAKLVQYIMKE